MKDIVSANRERSAIEKPPFNLLQEGDSMNTVAEVAARTVKNGKYKKKTTE